MADITAAAPDAPSSLLARATFDAAALFARRPPRIRHAGKRVVLEIAGRRGRRVPAGTLSVARFGPMRVPDVLPERAPVVTAVPDIYRYEEPTDPGLAWYVNFADADLFYAYGAAAFAQDEMQVAEHPVLGSLREALLEGAAGDLPPRTTDGGRPTPILIRGAERWCAIDTDPALASPYGIYGRRFHDATPRVLEQAVRVIDPATTTNLIAMEAPPGGRGVYTREEVEAILGTAFTAFAAARLESAPPGGQAGRASVHTGHWGTGAYGGNRVLMALLQLVAARLAGLDALVYHTVDPGGLEPVREAERILSGWPLAGLPASELLGRVAGLGLAWGRSDGN